MGAREAREQEQQGGPDEPEEQRNEQPDGPLGRVLRAPEILPVAAVGGAEEEVLDEDGDEEPEDDVAASDGLVERGDVARGLAVVAGEAEEQDHADGPEEDGEGDNDGGVDDGVCGAVGDDAGGCDGWRDSFGEAGAPEPEHDDVCLLRAYKRGQWDSYSFQSRQGNVIVPCMTEARNAHVATGTLPT